LRVQELERLVLMTSPVSHEGFLSWCLGLVDRDVAVSSPDGTAKAIFGRVLDFHLATSLRIPVHTVRVMAERLTSSPACTAWLQSRIKRFPVFKTLT